MSTPNFRVLILVIVEDGLEDIVSQSVKMALLILS